MSIQKEYGDYHLICDNCSREAENIFDSFDKAIDAKKMLGWESVKVSGQWEDWCDKCCRYEGGQK